MNTENYFATENLAPTENNNWEFWYNNIFFSNFVLKQNLIISHLSCTKYKEFYDFLNIWEFMVQLFNINLAVKYLFCNFFIFLK